MHVTPPLSPRARYHLLASPQHLAITFTCSSQYIYTYFTHAEDHDDVRKNYHFLDEALTNLSIHDQLPILFYLRGHTGQVLATCVPPCERYIATASEDTTVRLWTAIEGTLIWTFVDYRAAAGTGVKGTVRRRLRLRLGLTSAGVCVHGLGTGGWRVRLGVENECKPGLSVF